MGNTEKKRAEDAAISAGQQATVENAFDAWLKRGLRQLYGPVTEEPIPEALLKLIEQDRATRTK